MVKLIIIGIACGLVLSLFLSFGPGFWGLIQNSIRYGFRKGVAFEVGVNSSDIMMVMLALTIMNKDSITTLLRTPGASIVGGTVVILFGMMTILRRPSRAGDRAGRIRVVRKAVPTGRELLAQGFALNTLNPSVWLYWVALTAVVKAEIHLNDVQTFVFFISMLLAELGGGILKCRLASLLQNSLAESTMRGVSLIMGMILIALGGYLIGSMVVRIHHPERPDKEPSEVVTQIIQQSLGHIRTEDSLPGEPDSSTSTLQDCDTFYFQ